MRATARYYKENPAANHRRLTQQSAYQKTPKGKAIKQAANKLNRKLGTYGNGDGMDAAHYVGSKTKGRLQKASTNRSQKNTSRLKIRRHS